MAESDVRTLIIAALNDTFRKSIMQGGMPSGTIVFTQGIAALVPTTEAQYHVLRTVAHYTAFTEDNNPWGERDFGSFHLGDPPQLCYWKIDYYDRAREHGSEDPSDPEYTRRVLTVMLATEY